MTSILNNVTTATDKGTWMPVLKAISLNIAEDRAREKGGGRDHAGGM